MDSSVIQLHGVHTAQSKALRATPRFQNVRATGPQWSPDGVTGSAASTVHFPFHECLLLSPQLPPSDAPGRDADDSAGTFRVGVELWVMQQTSGECCQLELSHGGYHDGVMLMPKGGRVEPLVASEERWLAQTAQQDYNLFVRESFSAQLRPTWRAAIFHPSSTRRCPSRMFSSRMITSAAAAVHTPRRRIGQRDL